jgi:hypothetical protein
VKHKLSAREIDPREEGKRKEKLLFMKLQPGLPAAHGMAEPRRKEEEENGKASQFTRDLCVDTDFMITQKAHINALHRELLSVT